MKKQFFIFLILSLILVTGCSKENTVKVEDAKSSTTVKVVEDVKNTTTTTTILTTMSTSSITIKPTVSSVTTEKIVTTKKTTTKPITTTKSTTTTTTKPTTTATTTTTTKSKTTSTTTTTKTRTTKKIVYTYKHDYKSSFCNDTSSYYISIYADNIPLTDIVYILDSNGNILCGGRGLSIQCLCKRLDILNTQEITFLNSFGQNYCTATLKN